MSYKFTKSLTSPQQGRNIQAQAYLRGYMQKAAGIMDVITSRGILPLALGSMRGADPDGDPGHMVNLGEKLLSDHRVYGPHARREAAKADAYNERINAPYRMATYWEPVRTYLDSLRMPAHVMPNRSTNAVRSSHFVPGSRMSEPYIVVRPDDDDRLAQEMGSEERVRGGLPALPSSRRFPEDRKLSTWLHEAAHYATSPTTRVYRALNEFLRRAAGPHPDPSAGRGGGGVADPRHQATMYPERMLPEVIPPLSALQQHLFRTTGSRLETPEAYDKYMDYWDRLPIARFNEELANLPSEVQRLHRYRRTMHKEEVGGDVRVPAARPDVRRLQWYDRLNRKIVPGIVNRQTNDKHTRTA
jgi:hypothetical protein